MKAHYTQFVLTVITALLAWNLIIHRSPTVLAQGGEKYHVGLLFANNPVAGNNQQRKQMADDLARQLNRSAAGGELVTLLPVGDSLAVYAIFRDR